MQQQPVQQSPLQILQPPLQMLQQTTMVQPPLQMLRPQSQMLQPTSNFSSQMPQPLQMLQQPMQSHFSSSDKPTRNRNPNPSPAKIFVGGLPDMETEELTAYFAMFGSVCDAIVMRDGTGKPRGFGFVTFDNPEVRDAVLGMEHSLKERIVTLKPADGKGR